MTTKARTVKKQPRQPTEDELDFMVNDDEPLFHALLRTRPVFTFEVIDSDQVFGDVPETPVPEKKKTREPHREAL